MYRILLVLHYGNYLKGIQLLQYTDEQRYAANEIPILNILQDFGEETKRKGNEIIWTAHDSVRFSGSKWYRFATGESGHSVDLVMTFFGMDFAGAMDYLLQKYRPDLLRESNGQTRERTAKVSQTISNEGKTATPKRIAPGSIPQRNSNNTNLRNYLCDTRCIAPEIVSFFISEGILYESAGHHRVVFVGKDADGNYRNIQCRGTDDEKGKYRMNIKGSDMSYAFRYIGEGDKLYVFEAPIDMMSFISMYRKDWRRNSYISLNGISNQALMRTLQEYPRLQRVILCLDNDKAGNEASEKIGAELQADGYSVQRLKSKCKDWNEDLVARMNREGVVEWNQSLD